MSRTLLGLFVVGNLLLVSKIFPAPAQELDGTVKITRRSAAPGALMGGWYVDLQREGLCL